MVTVTLDTTMADLYADHGVTSPMVIDLYHNYAHIDLHKELPRETVFPEDEGPEDYGSTEKDLARFRTWGIGFKNPRMCMIMGPADVVLYTPGSRPEHIQRMLDLLPAHQRPRVRYINLDSGHVQEQYKAITDGKKLAFNRPKWWMVKHNHDTIIDPYMGFEINDKRFLAHPGIPTPAMENVSVTDPVLHSKPTPFVVKLCRNSSAAGTYLVLDEAARPDMLSAMNRFRSRGGTEVQLSEFIYSTEGTWGVNFFSGNGRWTYLAATEQISAKNGRWVATRVDYDAQADLKSRMSGVIDAVAKSLPSSYVGWVGIDVVVDRQRGPLVVDLNARQTGGMVTSLLCQHFTSRSMPHAQIDTFTYAGRADRIYEVLKQYLETGQVIITLASDVAENDNMASIIWGAAHKIELLKMRKEIERRLLS